jgi:hypothetical protein
VKIKQTWRRLEMFETNVSPPLMQSLTMVVVEAKLQKKVVIPLRTMAHNVHRHYATARTMLSLVGKNVRAVERAQYVQQP